MSASEKLWAQVALASTGQHGVQSVIDALGVINRALPQIVAVVEAAEFARDNPHTPSDLRWEDFDAALAALDAALSSGAGQANARSG